VFVLTSRQPPVLETALAQGLRDLRPARDFRAATRVTLRIRLPTGGAQVARHVLISSDQRGVVMLWTSVQVVVVLLCLDVLMSAAVEVARVIHRR